MLQIQKILIQKKWIDGDGKRGIITTNSDKLNVIRNYGILVIELTTQK